MNADNAIRQRIRSITESVIAGPLLLLASAVGGLVWVNISEVTYAGMWEATVSVGSGRWAVAESLQGWVNEGLMTFFFFAVGLEVKRELVVGELQDRRRAALPAIAAVGGMVMPALLFVVVNMAVAGGDVSGWAIPIATDIAFTLGVLALLGQRVPAHLRLFVLTLAIVDDVGGVLIIAIGFTESVSVGWLLAAVAVVLGLGLQRRLGSSQPAYYVPLGVALWYGLYRAGVEPTIAGVVLGLSTPARPVGGRAVLEELEHKLRFAVAFVVLPLFALGNTGIVIDKAVVTQAVRSPVAIGVVVGLVAGKAVGITLATRFALRMGVGALHHSVDPKLVAPVAVLAGIGFTVALFIAELSFSDPEALDQAKLGILAGSLVAGVAGTIAYRLVCRRTDADDRASI